MGRAELDLADQEYWCWDFIWLPGLSPMAFACFWILGPKQLGLVAKPFSQDQKSKQIKMPAAVCSPALLPSHPPPPPPTPALRPTTCFREARWESPLETKDQGPWGRELMCILMGRETLHQCKQPGCCGRVGGGSITMAPALSDTSWRGEPGSSSGNYGLQSAVGWRGK